MLRLVTYCPHEFLHLGYLLQLQRLVNCHLRESCHLVLKQFCDASLDLALEWNLLPMLKLGTCCLIGECLGWHLSLTLRLVTYCLHVAWHAANPCLML